MSAIILGIETSCDETSAAVVSDGGNILSNVIYSQIKEHAEYGGVVPEIASRRHTEKIVPVVDEALRQAGVSLNDVDAISATFGPGLVGALLVGLSFAKGLARAAKKPFIGVHHIAAHICANALSSPPVAPPFTALVVSGGHSHIYGVKNYYTYRLLGRTRDDAAGEVFDKVARASGLGYPGGPKLNAAAVGGNPDAIRFPRTYFRDNTFDFSFSGVKTSAINYLNRERMRRNGSVDDMFLRDFYASFQEAVVDALITTTLAAETANPTGKIVLAGGVAANSALREKLPLAARLSDKSVTVHFPPPILCTDNAAMVASRAYFDFIRGAFSPLSLGVTPTMPLVPYKFEYATKNTNL